eukprot:3457058-Pyramimonas_sp.AAC.1
MQVILAGSHSGQSAEEGGADDAGGEEEHNEAEHDQYEKDETQEHREGRAGPMHLFYPNKGRRVQGHCQGEGARGDDGARCGL